MASGTTPAHPLDAFSSCELSDALIKLQVVSGGHIPDIVYALPTSYSTSESGSHNDVPTSARGPAYTVQMVMSTNTDAPKLDKHFVDTAEPRGCVIVIDVPRGEWKPSIYY